MTKTNSLGEGVKPSTLSPNKINTLMELSGRKPSGAKQGNLDLGIDRRGEVDGVEMGVLSDGTPFLTGRGLARLCGVAHTVIQDLSDDWQNPLPKGRVAAIMDILLSHGATSLEKPYIAINHRSGVVFAYPDSICLAVLEYYAFEAGANCKPLALRNYRLLAGQALRDYIYTQVGYNPNSAVGPKWKQFHDRVSLLHNLVPPGYFCIFQEISQMLVTLGEAGAHTSDKFIPDISVGGAWAKHWSAQTYDWHYGDRIRFDHIYPSYFPQAASNPQETWCYPEAALGEFRRWLRDNYIGDGKLEAYLRQKVQQHGIEPSFAHLALEAYRSNQQ